MNNTITVRFEPDVHDVFTLTAVDLNGEIVEAESFYLSVYACAEDREDDAEAWIDKHLRCGFVVRKIDGWGEIDRI